MSPFICYSMTIYTLYEINSQIKTILNTYPDDVTQIKLYGEYIYLNMKLNNKPLQTKEEYEDFKLYIKNIINTHSDESLEFIKIKQLLNIFYKSFSQINESLPNYDSYSLNIDLTRFQHLKLLHIYRIYLNTIKNIPEGVNTIIIIHSFLKKIDNLPTGLKQLCCKNNQLNKLPSLQHCELILLNVSNNNIYMLPLLPNSIEYLYLNNNKILNIPNFPKSLKHLECSHNKIMHISYIAKNIQTIICDHNQICQLPYLSEFHFLKTLICNSNLIKELPPLPNGIEYINYSDNPIEIFVPFPFSIIE